MVSSEAFLFTDGSEHYKVPGQRELLWILDVDGVPLVIEAVWEAAEASARDRAEVRQIAESVRVDPRSGDEGAGATGATDAIVATAATGVTARNGPTAPTGSAAPDDCIDLTGEGGVFTVVISGFAFVPDCFIASASQGISIVNEDAALHSFTMTGTEINIPVSGGETFNGEPIGGIVEVGSYDFLCTIHLLMNGEVTVVA